MPANAIQTCTALEITNLFLQFSMAFFIIELYEYFPNKFFCVGEERILSPFYSGKSVNLLNSHKKSTWLKHLKFTFSQWHCMSLCPCGMCKGKEEFWLLVFLSFIMWPLSITHPLFGQSISFIFAHWDFPLGSHHFHCSYLEISTLERIRSKFCLIVNSLSLFLSIL